jgi:hypothetical protein
MAGTNGKNLTNGQKDNNGPAGNDWRKVVNQSFSSLLMPEHADQAQSTQPKPTPSYFAPEYYDTKGQLKGQNFGNFHKIQNGIGPSVNSAAAQHAVYEDHGQQHGQITDLVYRGTPHSAVELASETQRRHGVHPQYQFTTDPSTHDMTVTKTLRHPMAPITPDYSNMFSKGHVNSGVNGANALGNHSTAEQKEIGSGPPITYALVVARSRAAGDPHPEVAGGQWANESGWGSAPTGKNNVFGVKSKPGHGSLVVTHEEDHHGNRNKVTAWFQDYPSVDDAIRERVYKVTNGIYASAGYNKAKTNEEAIDALIRAGYATKHNYRSEILDAIASGKKHPYRRYPRRHR